MELWKPSNTRTERARVAQFIETLPNAQRFTAIGNVVERWSALYQWSLDEPEQFWSSAFDFLIPTVGEKGDRIVARSEKFEKHRWFPDAALNYAENLLTYRDDAQALVFWGEDKTEIRYTYAELTHRVSTLANELLACGLRVGDRVAAFVPNHPDTIVAMLATTALGGIWSSCSPDFGVSGAIDRFGQIEPKFMFTADGYWYRGLRHDSIEKVAEIVKSLPTVERTFVFNYTDANPDLTSLPNAVNFTTLYQREGSDIPFVRLPFNHPLFIMFSSGTTGKPKCIVHGAGGTLLEQLKELILHTDLQLGDKIFYQTTCGWMMWNWLVSSLAVGATVVLYDGYPFAREGRILFDLAEKTGITIFGTNAKFIAALEKEGVKPKETHDLSALRSILSTGSPLLPESFDYVYRDIKSDVCLSSISGGTDILGCFALGSPYLPVHRSELQSRTLGYAIEVWNDDGEAVVGEKGELVCLAPFPSMPVGFWNDPSNEKFHAAYFGRFENVWHHGDYVELTPRGGLIFYGRSDAVLNPGGIRIGTAEIYRQVEQLPEILESIVVGQSWKGDVRVVLFVKLAAGAQLDSRLEERIRAQIRKNTTPFHVPKKIVAVSDIPRTRNGKIVELAVRDTVAGIAPKNIEALANPEALHQFTDRSELAVD